MIYLDNAATTRPYPEVVDLVAHCLDNFGNPSSTYPAGVKARKLVNDARQRLAKAFGVPEAGVVFCGSGTESDNLALKGVLQSGHAKTGGLITTGLEHSAVLKTAAWLQQEGIRVDLASIDTQSGQIDLDNLAELVQPDTKLVSIQHVNSETGIIQDLAAISRVVKNRNPKTLVHSDGVQAFTKFPINIKSLGIDLYSISGHKFHGIKGAGALIMARQIPLEPVIHGGGQEFGLRSGTENVAAIAAMGKAAEISLSQIEKSRERVTAFSRFFIEQLKDRFSNIRCITAENRVPHIISLSVPGILGEVLLNHLAQEDIFVATGSACNAGSKHLSPVLREMGFPPDRIRETIRISLAACEVPDDPDDLVIRFNRIIETLLDIL